MTWFRIDDKFAEHPKVRRLAKDRVPAVGVWTLCGVWCADNLGDGFVPTEVVRRYDPRLKHARRLVEVGLWHETEQEGEFGFEFHQWSEHQPTRAEVEEKRRKTAKKVADWRAKRAAQKATEAEQDDTGNPGCNPVTEVVSNPPRNPAPDPTRPDPTRTSPKGEVRTTPSLRSGEPRKRATRIPEDFAITDDMAAWAHEHTPLVRRSETDNFRDYWAGATKNATKLDWVATWRMWMRRAQSDAESRPASPRRSGPRTADDKIRDLQALKTTGTNGPAAPGGLAAPSLYALPRGGSQ